MRQPFAPTTKRSEQFVDSAKSGTASCDAVSSALSDVTREFLVGVELDADFRGISLVHTSGSVRATERPVRQRPVRRNRPEKIKPSVKSRL